ncbi:GTPase domain-containing protein [Actinoplanes sp. NPDC023801]|uniref:GTPase domain-containing protein n=1 Tax=Actinoplanes sp. NPDC023801 TaxID=3154595 RepID=UPI0033FA0BAF
MISDELERRTHDLLVRAAHVYRGHPHAGARLRRTLERFAGPLRLAVAGAERTGKSTLVNALVGELVAPVEQAGFVTYQDGTQPRGWRHPEHGRPYEVPVTRTADGLRLGLDAPAPRAVVQWPSRVLRRTELIDTGPSLPPGTVLPEADAVLLLTPQIGEPDLDFLRAGRGLRGPAAFPIHALVVLSRADTHGDGLPDGLLEARRIARRRRREPLLASLCQDVVAVSPLIGYAARTLRDDEFRALAAIAALPRADSDPHLLSTDRFTAAAALPVVDPRVRIELLRRFGLGGIRLALALVRTGSATTAALAERLHEYSGLKDLQTSVSELFVARRAALKARSALIVLDHLLRTERLPPSGQLLAELELLLAGAHDFAELRLLSALRSGRVTLPAETAREALRLLGGAGTSLGERLGLPTEATVDHIWTVAGDSAGRWRHEAGSGARTPAQRRAAAVVLRSCEAILADGAVPASDA